MQNDSYYDEDGILVLVIHGGQSDEVVLESIAATDAALAGRPPNSVLHVIDLSDTDDEIGDEPRLAYQRSLVRQLSPGSGALKAACFAGGSAYTRNLARYTLSGPEVEGPVKFAESRAEARAWLLSQ